MIKTIIWCPPKRVYGTSTIVANNIYNPNIKVIVTITAMAFALNIEIAI